MGYDYYEQRRREEEKHTYRNKFGFIIPQYSASMDYSLGDMDSESAKKYEFNHPINAVISFMEKTKELNKLHVLPDLSLRDSKENKKLGPSFDINDILKSSRLK
jgi:hypothetical protein